MDDLSATRLSGGICAGGGIEGGIDDDCSNTGFALVINGHSLVYALQPKLEKLFLDVGTQCSFFVTLIINFVLIRNYWFD